MTRIRLLATLTFLCAIAGPATTVATADEAKKVDWEKMDKGARKKYMKTVVMPEMKKLFVAFDAKKYATFGCPTCHGEGAVQGTFKMPNAELPKLPAPTDKAGFMALMQKKPEMAKFMSSKVKPTMASLLGMPEWTPEKPVGFSCYGCHTHQ